MIFKLDWHVITPAINIAQPPRPGFNSCNIYVQTSRGLSVHNMSALKPREHQKARLPLGRYLLRRPPGLPVRVSAALLPPFICWFWNVLILFIGTSNTAGVYPFTLFPRSLWNSIENYYCESRKYHIGIHILINDILDKAEQTLLFSSQSHTYNRISSDIRVWHHSLIVTLDSAPVPVRHV